MRSILALLAFTNAAWAECGPNEQTFMSCQIENSSDILRVCFDETDIHYRFGPRGKTPELALSDSIAMVDYLPWPGLGRAIWESVTFRTGDYAYEVTGGFERPFDEEAYEDIPHRSFGSVYVTRGGEDLIDLSCDRSTVDFAWDVRLWTAKTDLGFSWNDREKVWVELPD